MTDNELIKALERTASWVCDVCKFHGKMCVGDKCEKVIAENALDLINHQDAEIERLKAENKILSKNADTAFQDGLNEAQDLYAAQIQDKIKSEAIKEFAERLKENIPFITSHLGNVSVMALHRTIDNLVKEMTEVSE